MSQPNRSIPGRRVPGRRTTDQDDQEHAMGLPTGIGRGGVVVLAMVLVGMLVVVAGSAAGAHVTVHPREVPAGGFAKLVFRVPNERPDAATVALAVQLPPEHPFGVVAVQPVPGWDHEVAWRPAPGGDPGDGVHGHEGDRVAEAVTWTGGRIAAGEFQEFAVLVGLMPAEATTLVFPARQTYDDGEVVAWVEVPVTGEPEPAHPAAVLEVVDEAPPPDDAEDVGATLADVDAARRAATLALIVGVAGLLAGVTGLLRLQRRSPRS